MLQLCSVSAYGRFLPAARVILRLHALLVLEHASRLLDIVVVVAPALLACRKVVLSGSSSDPQYDGP
jgi:hypothetical protein